MPGGSATSLIAYHGSLLSMDVFPPRLERFDAKLGAPQSTRFPPRLPTGMALDSLGALWVTDYDAARVWRLDPEDGTAEGPALAVGRDPTRVATSGNYVWVANTGDDTITVINQQANQSRGVPLASGGTSGRSPVATTPPEEHGRCPGHSYSSFSRRADRFPRPDSRARTNRSVRSGRAR